MKGGPALLLISFVTVVVSGCAPTPKRNECSASQSALSIANAFIAKHMPDEMQPNYPKPVVTDSGNTWEVAYGLPEGMTGGAPTVFVGKRTCKIDKAESGQ